MAALTVELDDDLMADVKRRLADQKGVTVSSIVREALARFVGRNLRTRYDWLQAFAGGAVSRQAAQEALGLTYGELLLSMSMFDLPLPRVDQNRARADAEKIAMLLRAE